MKPLLPAVLITALMLLMSGCDSGATSDPVPTPTPTPTPLPEFVQCTSTEPVDSGNPNKPVITLLGERVVNHLLGTPYTDAGATATDPHDGDLTGRITVSGLADLNTNLVGDYLIRYNVVDSTQLHAVEVARLVRVNAGTFAAQTMRDIGTTGAHLGYYEHLPLNYTADPNQRFPLIIYQHGWSGARFLDAQTVQRPLSGISGWGLAGLINGGNWDDSRPFVVLSPQRCVDPRTAGLTAYQTKLFIDYAVNTYKVDPTRIYLGGHSMGSMNTWDYVYNYPRQLAAVFPVSGGYGSFAGCTLGQTPAWAFIGQSDITVPYQDQVTTVEAINACNPPERAKLTVFPGIGHLDIEYPLFVLTGLGWGMPQYDIYDQSIFDWLLQHSRPQTTSAAVPGQSGDTETAAPAAVAVPAPATSGSLAAIPATIVTGHTTTLKWSVEGAVTCLASGDWVGSRPSAGTESVTPPAPGVYNYVLSCDGPTGTVAYSTTLEVRTEGAP